VDQNKIPDFTEAYNEATAFVFNGILPVVTHSIDTK
jgi:hypothetical protein